MHMNRKLAAGDISPIIRAKNIQGAPIDIPSSAGLVHLQFRRHSGCPACNRHLQSFARRIGELRSAGIAEVAIYHSPTDELLPHQGHFPFDVIGDPSKTLYRQFGVESSITSLLHPAAWSAMVIGSFVREKPTVNVMPTGGVLGLPADFLIAPDGIIKAMRYGRHADDQWSVDDVLSLR